ncbi:hypothetical protein [Collimonas sp. OK607]|uniref:hypothetical protein n=1 Tax=Collimonas sp. OK607 TaxID=1798194 RepID=UPI001113CBA5|nr:hypothetical protein [Collimonas sp. OK607]
MTKHGLGGSLLCASAFADDQTTLTTRAGKLSITGDAGNVSLFLDRKKLTTETDSMGMSFKNKFVLNDKDVVLVADGVSATCQLNFFVTVASKSDVKISPSFGTCDDGPQVIQSGARIMLRMKDEKGRKVKYIFENGVISENGKILKAE